MRSTPRILAATLTGLLTMALLAACKKAENIGKRRPQ